MTNPDINFGVLDSKLQIQIARLGNSFNSASFNVFIRTNTPIAPGNYLDQNGQAIPGVVVRGTGPATIQTGTVTGAALSLLSKDPNVVSISGSTQLRPC